MEALDDMECPIAENIRNDSSHLLKTNFLRLARGGGGRCDRLKHPGL